MVERAQDREWSQIQQWTQICSNYVEINPNKSLSDDEWSECVILNSGKIHITQIKTDMDQTTMVIRQVSSWQKNMKMSTIIKEMLGMSQKWWWRKKGTSRKIWKENKDDKKGIYDWTDAVTIIGFIGFMQMVYGEINDICDQRNQRWNIKYMSPSLNINIFQWDIWGPTETGITHLK